MHRAWHVLIGVGCCAYVSQPLTGGIATLTLTIKGTVLNEAWDFLYFTYKYYKGRTTAFIFLFCKSYTSVCT